jgi:hypothetical protein
MNERVSSNGSNGNRPAAMRPALGPGGMRSPMGHGPMAMMKGESARDFKGTMRKLIAYLGPYRWLMLLVLFLAAASTVFQIFGPKILGNATTKLFEGLMGQISGSGAGVDFSAIGRILMTALVLYVFSAILGYLQGWIMTGIAIDITYRMRREIGEKVHRLPLRYFDGTTHGEVLSRLTNDVDTVNQTLGQSLSQIVSSAVTVVGVLAMMLSISWQMTLVALLVIPLTLGLVQPDRHPLTALFPPAAGLPGACERPHRGDVRWPGRDQGLQRGSPQHTHFSRAKHDPLQHRLEIPISLRDHDADDELHRQPGLCGWW